MGSGEGEGREQIMRKKKRERGKERKKRGEVERCVPVTHVFLLGFSFGDGFWLVLLLFGFLALLFYNVVFPFPSCLWPRQDESRDEGESGDSWPACGGGCESGAEWERVNRSTRLYFLAF